MVDVKQLAKQFLDLIAERDSEIDYYGGYNGRCYEIDDKLIPRIISQIPKGKMDEFNTLINSVKNSCQENKIPPLEEDIDPRWIYGFKGCI